MNFARGSLYWRLTTPYRKFFPVREKALTVAEVDVANLPDTATVETTPGTWQIVGFVYFTFVVWDD